MWKIWKVSKLSEPLKLDTLYALSDFQVLVQKSLTEHPSLCMEIRNNYVFDPFYLKGIFDNDSMSMTEGCPNNELLELLKTKKHARIFVHMLKYFENENHILHNNISESKSLIKKYKGKKSSVEWEGW